MRDDHRSSPAALEAVSNFRTINRDAGFLLPPSVDEGLPQRHLARFVVEVIDGPDLSELVKACRGSGSASYHPAMLLGPLVHGYATRVFSSRAIQRATVDSVAFRHIAGNEHPDHDTKEVRQLLHLAEAKAKLSGKKPGGRPPEPLTGGVREKDQINLADEDSRIMKTAGGGFEQCCNAQAAVAAGSLLVVANAVAQAGNGKQRLVPMLEKLKALPQRLGRCQRRLADTGYLSEANVERCAAARIEPLIALGRTRHHVSWKQRFATAPKSLTAPAAPLQKMVHRLKTPAGRKLYGLRKQTPESVFGIIKSVMGYRQTLLRGPRKRSRRVESGDPELEHQANVRPAVLLHGHRGVSTGHFVTEINMRPRALPDSVRSTVMLSPTG
jgi:transposase